MRIYEKIEKSIHESEFVHPKKLKRLSNYKVGNKNKNKLKSAKRFRNNDRQCSTDKS